MKLVAGKVALGLLALSCVAALGCDRIQTAAPERSSGGALISSADELRPDADIGNEAVLDLGGLEVPVEVRTSRENANYVLAFWAHDEEFETERYRVAPESFQLVHAAGEGYDPPMPLLKFPMHVGDEWTWTGKLVAGGIAHKTQAKLSTREDQVKVGAESVSALLVEADLEIESGGPNPAKRRLAFWFVPKRGLLQREFGVSTKRMPPAAPAQEAAVN